MATNRIFNTGVGANGLPLPLGHIDEHWKYVPRPGVKPDTPTVYVVNPIPSGYFMTTDSNWVWFDLAGDALVKQAFPYVFRTSFELDFDSRLLFAQISIRWGADNYGFITINGLPPAAWSGEISLPYGNAPNNFAQPHDVSISDPFQSVFNVNSGTNYLEISVFNFGMTSTGNPSGFNVSGSDVTLILRPEFRRKPSKVLFHEGHNPFTS